MHRVLIPRLNANDDNCVVSQWASGDGEWVRAGTVLAVLETSKVAMDLVAEVDGWLHCELPQGSEARVGEVIGYLFPDPAALTAFRAERTAVPGESGPLRITQKAQRVMAKYGLTPDDLASLGKAIIREADVQVLVAARADEAAGAMGGDPGRLRVLTRHQLTVARTVALARREIPDGFMVIKVFCDRALDFLAARTAKQGLVIGLVEALIWLVAQLRSGYPHCFGTVIDETRFLPAMGAHIGVTLDQGAGLFVPVVHAADGLTLEEIAEVMDEYRYRALRGEFDAASLSGGVFSIALIAEPDVVFSMPILMPGQVCMLSLPAVLSEPVWDEGKLVARRVSYLGFAYDHRFINGREASAFCRDLKYAVERLGDEHVNR
jgi:2-oxoglutarate dehydrogenase E2 component (dihydrolipoamide succinyltransferase)